MDDRDDNFDAFGADADAPKPLNREEEKKGVRERVCGVLSSLVCLAVLVGFCLLFGLAWTFVLSPLFLILFVIGVIACAVGSVVAAARGV